MTFDRTRREFIRRLGLSPAILPFVGGLPGVVAATAARPKQRLVVIFSPNGIVPKTFWPDEQGAEFHLKESLTPLEPFKDRLLILRGVCDKVRGDGDAHMRGIGCLLTGIELYPGNIQGGSDTPAGWAKGLSIDQEIKNFLQADPATRTRFGSLEFGVQVPERADTWTRMVYSGPNQPVAPIDNPYRMFAKMYGRSKDRGNLASVLDTVKDDLKAVAAHVGSEDRELLDRHAAFVREMEQELRSDSGSRPPATPPELEPGVRNDNDQMPRLSRMQIDLLVNGFVNDFNRVATLQYTQSVGGARMKWIGVSENHHELSHKPDSDKVAQEQLTRINKWFCEQVAYLAKRLAETPEPGGGGTMLDHTLIVWTNELGQGNSHTLDNIPFVLVGGCPGFAMGRSLKLPKLAHNRLLLSLAHGFGHHITKFGNPDYCGGGPLSLS